MMRLFGVTVGNIDFTVFTIWKYIPNPQELYAAISRVDSISEDKAWAIKCLLLSFTKLSLGTNEGGLMGNVVIKPILVHGS